MKWVSGSGALFYSVADSPKSTDGDSSPRASGDNPTPFERRPARVERGRAQCQATLSRLVRRAYATTLSVILLAATPAAAGQAPGITARPMPTPVGTMSELMVKIIYPASDAIFYITTRTPASVAEWNDLQGKALMVAESANLLMMPAHMRDEDRWLADAKLMRDAGMAAFKAAKAKDAKALENLNDAMYQSCVTCHQHYRPNYGRRP